MRIFVVVSTSALLLGVAGCQDRRTTERSAEGMGPQVAGRQVTTVQGAGSISGEVVSAKGDEIVLKEQGSDEELKLKVSDSTQVFIEDRKASADDLREGAQVRASFDTAQGERRAIRVDARSEARSAGDQPGGSAGTTGGLGGASSRTPGQMGGPGGDSATSASEPGAPRGEPGKSEAQTPEKK